MQIINEKYKNLEIYEPDFKSSKPYPHIVLDNFLDKSFFENLDVNKVDVNNKGALFNTEIEKNKWTSKNVELSEGISQIVNELYKDEFIKSLGKLSKIKD